MLNSNVLFDIHQIGVSGVDMYKYVHGCVLFLSGILCTSIFYPSRNHQINKDNYQIIHRIPAGLKAHTKFTGRQFLIINHDPFDWIDVKVTINTRTRENIAVATFLESGASIFVIPRIRAGEVYTLQTNNLEAQALPGLQDSLTQIYDLRILATTPWGQSSWDGRWERSASWAPARPRHGIHRPAVMAHGGGSIAPKNHDRA
jgi:hypothetical protein